MDFDSVKKVGLGIGLGVGLSFLLRKMVYPSPLCFANAPSEEESQKSAEANKAPLPKIRAATAAPPMAQSAQDFRISDLVERAEHCFPNNIAVVSSPPKTYAQLARRIRCQAHVFASKLKLEPGCRVAVLSLNSEDYLECFFSVSFAGLLIVPLNYRLPLEDLIDILLDAQCSALLVDEKFTLQAEQIASRFPAMKLIRLDKSKAPGSLEALMLESPALAEPVATPRNVYGIFYTSGTTGKHKGVMLTHEGLLFNAYALSHAVKLDEQMRYLHCAPMFHIADSTSTFAVTMVGAAHAFVPAFHAEQVLQSIQYTKATHTLLVPSMFPVLLAQMKKQKPEFDVSSMRYFFYGSSPMKQQVITEAMRAFPKAKFVQGYGMTETSPVMTFLGAEHHFPGSLLMQSVGQCVPHGLLRICDANGVEVPRGVLGEVFYRGPNVMAGYINKPQESKDTLLNGWLRTGDGGRMDANGFVFLADRISQLIKTSPTTSVYSFEVETAICELEQVVECAVLGVKNNGEFEQVAAVVVIDSDNNDKLVTKEKIHQACASAKLEEYKWPQNIVFTQDRLPLNALGKVSKSVLRSTYF